MSKAEIEPRSFSIVAKLAGVIWPFVLLVVLQGIFTVYSLNLLSSVRAYVAGEGIWSKAQQRAVFNLQRYADTAEPSFYGRYRKATAIPSDFTEARLALTRPRPDVAAARTALLRAGNHPDDVPGLTWLFGQFRGLAFFDRSIDDWAKADVQLDHLHALAETMHQGISAGTATAQDRARWGDEIAAIDDRIVPLAAAFTQSMGESARTIRTLLGAISVALAAALALLATWRTHRFLSGRRSLEQTLSWQASHDEMTELPNRRSFEARLKAMLPNVGGAPFALMLLDVDQLKITNDSGGPAAGDALLRQIAAALRASVRGDDIVARIGGDEFGVVLGGCPPHRAYRIAERLRAAVQDLRFSDDGWTFNATVSIGVVNVREGISSFGELMQAADLACAIAKEKGCNRVQMYSYGDDDLLRRSGEMNWVQRIQQALDEDRFVLYAQKFVSLRPDEQDGRLQTELLIRLRGEDGELIHPQQFIPAAERFGLMPRIDRWVVRTAFELIARRLADPLAAPLALCAINLSGASINDDSFLDFVRGQFAAHGVPPSLVCFEITETSAIANLASAANLVVALRDIGCTFALDDFGTGMASFAYLKHLPVAFVKIDGGFVKDMLVDRVDRAMVEMINHIGHVMGKRTIAEFVESDALLEVLREIGVDCAQGYAVERPIPFALA
ncbi:MAG TPA: EAL domain-containing protein [Xanthobacteraceae bacterium]|nr:EAL domain-containing protein [Xanthobacteraceae bacterium]